MKTKAGEALVVAILASMILTLIQAGIALLAWSMFAPAVGLPGINFAEALALVLLGRAVAGNGVTINHGS